MAEVRVNAEKIKAIGEIVGALVGCAHRTKSEILLGEF
jgi:hypothetical protein